MLVEGLFVYLPTIIAITLAFFVGVGVGLFLCSCCILCFFFLLFKIPSCKETILDYFNKES